MTEPSPLTSGPSARRPRTARRWRPWLWALRRQLLRAGSDPILVGPWTSEVGFEALYWLPWLARLRRDLGLPAARLIPISRGGAAGWYGVPKGLELYEMRTPQEMRVAQRLQHLQTGSIKQMAVTSFDRAVLADAAKTLGLGRRAQVLHPAWCYQTLAPFWDTQRGVGWLADHLDLAHVVTMPVLEGVTLPDHFVAVRFYFRPTFPMNPTTVQFAKETIKQLAAQQPVIVLNSGLSLDDHLDYVPTNVSNVTVLADRLPLTPANNLLVQGAILAKADAFVGTYGGLAQLALRLKKPSISVYDEWHSTGLAHKHVSDTIATLTGVPFTVLSLRMLPQLQHALPTVTVSVPTSSVALPGLIDNKSSATAPIMV